jgi:serine/threonine-protein kinase
MSIGPGARLGPYEIVAGIGSGGMGEVYRATDTVLGRQVAIKVLPGTVATDPERLARFEREAKTLAVLNHPHIAQIYGFERSGATPALVMELVEGETLADRIARGPLPVDDALAIARQIAEALEAAHAQGIVHRDLKPANIKITPSGDVKVLDFGLAKLADSNVARLDSQAVSLSPTITSPAMTGVGVLLGTAAYMAPEQAKGKPADKRSDIWAFGCVLYEMLVAKRAFEGDDAVETLAYVMAREPDSTRLPPNVPRAIRTLIRRCLERNQRKRVSDIAVALYVIEEAAVADGSIAEPSKRANALAMYAVVPMIVTAGVIGWIIGARQRPATPAAAGGPARLTLPVSRGTELGEGASVAISPDGARVAYVARRGGVQQLYVRAMNDSDVRVLPGTEGAGTPVFSPDGQWIAFLAGGKLKKVSIAGSVVVPLADANENGGIAWADTHTILFTAVQPGGLRAISDAGGTPKLLIDGTGARHPQLVPGSDIVLFTSRGGSTPDQQSIETFNLRTQQRKVIIQGGYAPYYLPTGHLVFQRSGTVMAAAFDSERLELTGTPVPVIEGVKQPFTGVGAFSCSRSGTCVYVAGAPYTQRTVAFVDRAGVSQTVPLPPRSYTHPRFSPDGDKLLFWIQQLRCELEIYDVARRTTIRLVSDADTHDPIWIGNGSRVAYRARKPGMTTPGYELFSRLASGSGSDESMRAMPLNLGDPVSEVALAPDGRSIVFADRGDIWSLPPSGEPTRLVQSSFNDASPAVSPDGRWLAYWSDESGRPEVYVQAFSGPAEKRPVSTDGGTEPVWSRDGRELFFRSGDQMMVVEVGRQSALSTSRPRPLFAATFTAGDSYANYDVSPDGMHFVVVNPGEDERGATDISVLLNWTDELKGKIPAGRR